jgi:hypothetical protein
MATLTTHPKLTYREFADFPDDGLRHEILDGEHVVGPAPSRIHQRVSCSSSALASTCSWKSVGWAKS